MRNLAKRLNDGQKLEVKIRGSCSVTTFRDVNGMRYHFDGRLGKQQLPKTWIPIEFN